MLFIYLPLVLIADFIIREYKSHFSCFTRVNSCQRHLFKQNLHRVKSRKSLISLGATTPLLRSLMLKNPKLKFMCFLSFISRVSVQPHILIMWSDFGQCFKMNVVDLEKLMNFDPTITKFGVVS